MAVTALDVIRAMEGGAPGYVSGWIVDTEYPVVVGESLRNFIEVRFDLPGVCSDGGQGDRSTELLLWLSRTAATEWALLYASDAGPGEPCINGRCVAFRGRRWHIGQQAQLDPGKRIAEVLDQMSVAHYPMAYAEMTTDGWRVLQ